VPEVASVTIKVGEKPVLSGKLPAGESAMKIVIGDNAWELGAPGSALVKAGDGWKLALPDPLPAGKHAVTVVVSDEAGNTAQKTYQGAITVLPAERKAEPQPAPQPVADANKCQRDISAFLKENKIRFQTDSDLLTDEGMRVVARLANLIRKCPGLRFHIVGHTDSRGSFQYNRELSEMRAKTVKNALVGAGIAAERLTTEGAGESFPLASNATEEGRAMNRRIEVKVLRPE
jgi:outer membrane protein OmpA-like peptidoglycan-associated protein